jgi:hypothetical protein
MATIDRALTTLERVKNRLGLKETNFDILLEQIINSVTDWIESQCNNRRFKQTSYTNEIFDGSPSPRHLRRNLVFMHIPIISLSSFKRNIGLSSSPIWSDVFLEEYQLLDKEGMIYMPAGLPVGRRNIKVSYVAGYKIDFSHETDATKHNLPFDISALAERLAVKEFKRREDVGKSGETVGDATVNYFDHLEEEDKATITKYKRLIFQ